MKIVQGKPITGSKAQFRPMRPPASNDSARFGSSAEQNISATPTPFRFHQSAVNVPAGSAGNKAIPTGDGKSKNPAGLQTGSKPTIAATGNRVPGGYSKVVGGQKGTNHPSRKGDVTMGTSAHRNHKFFGR